MHYCKIPVLKLKNHSAPLQYILSNVKVGEGSSESYFGKLLSAVSRHDRDGGIPVQIPKVIILKVATKKILGTTHIFMESVQFIISHVEIFIAQQYIKEYSHVTLKKGRHRAGHK
jgi:hypothetical protein